MLGAFELRRRARGTVGIALVVGLVGAVVFAAAAGARRSETALARFSSASRSGDLALQPAFGYSVTSADLRALGRIPQVAAFAVVRFPALFPVGGPSDNHPAVPLDEKFGTVVDRSRLVAGRRANPRIPDEATIGEALAAQLHEGVGGHLDYMSYTPEQLRSLGSTATPPPPAGPRLRLRIVGIVRRPDDLGDISGATNNVVLLTPAFDDAYAKRVATFGALLEIRTRNGTADVAQVTASARAIFAKSGGLSVTTSLNDTHGAQSAINILTLALWILAGVGAAAGVVALAIILSREISHGNVEGDTLRSLGLTRRQRILVSGPTALVVWSGGALIAGIGAVALSPLFPFGVARRADPSVGVHVDRVVLASGSFALALIVLVIVFAAALRSTRRPSDRSSYPRRSPLVDTAARAGAPPTVTHGLRMAVERGKGNAAVPIRSAYVGAVLGVAGVVAVLVFASNLHHLVSTPRLYGATWDFYTADKNFSADPKTCDSRDLGLAHVGGVGAIAGLCYNQIELGGQPVTGWAFTPVRDTISPEVVAGRAPLAPDEVALGTTTLHALHKHVGDTVAGHGPSGAPTYRIVGRVVFPTLDQAQALADGGVFTDAGLIRIFDSNNTANRYLLFSLAPGADHRAVVRHIAAIPALGPPTRGPLPIEISRVQHVDWLPTALAAFFAALAILAVGHALITTVRRRRRDLAVLQTLGFQHRQTRHTIAWQATTLTTIALVIGFPLGIAAGKFTWQLVADGLGVATAASLPIVAILLTVPAALIIVNAIAFYPARAAARTPPATAFRAE